MGAGPSYASAEAKLILIDEKFSNNDNAVEGYLAVSYEKSDGSVVRAPIRRGKRKTKYDVHDDLICQRLGFEQADDDHVMSPSFDQFNPKRSGCGAHYMNMINGDTVIMDDDAFKDCLYQNVGKYDQGKHASKYIKCIKSAMPIDKSCDDGYYRPNTGADCLIKQCRCENGIAVDDGIDCATHGSNLCQSCNAGYDRSGDECLISEQESEAIKPKFVLWKHGLQIEGYHEMNAAEITRHLDEIGNAYESNQGFSPYEDRISIDWCDYCTADNYRWRLNNWPMLSGNYEDDLNTCKDHTNNDVDYLYGICTGIGGADNRNPSGQKCLKQAEEFLEVTFRWNEFCGDASIVHYALFIDEDY